MGAVVSTPLGWSTLLAAVALLFSGESYAAAPAASGSGVPAGSGATQSGGGLSREQVNPVDQTRPARRQRPTDVFSGPSKELCQLSGDPALGFMFKQGIIEDEGKVLSDHDRRVAFGDLVGRRITPRELCDVRDRLAARIFDRHVLARVIIPPQTISSGVVKFRVIAAKIVSVRFDGADIGAVQEKVEAFLNHLRRRDSFDLDSAQRWLLLVNDIPGVQATAKIVHSTAPGAPAEGLDLVVTLRRVAVDEFGSVANTNSYPSGPWSALARVDLNSLTPLGERTTLVAYSTLANNRQQVAQIIESARIGDSGLFSQASFSFGHSRPGNVLAPLDLTGFSYVGSFELDYPLLRLQRETLVVATGMDLINQTTSLPTGQAVADDALRVVWARADGSMAAVDRPWGDNLVSTAVDLSLQGRKGLEVLGASEPGAMSLSRSGGRADAWGVRAESHATLRIAPENVRHPPFTFSAHIVGQWADRPLLGYEQQAIGNLTIGRGYDPSAASGDRVIAGDVKVEWGPLRLRRTATVTPYIFYDMARVDYLTKSTPDVTLRSLGGGLEVAIPYDNRGDSIRIDAGYAEPLDRPVPASGKKPPERFLIQIVVTH